MIPASTPEQQRQPVDLLTPPPDRPQLPSPPERRLIAEHLPPPPDRRLIAELLPPPPERRPTASRPDTTVPERFLPYEPTGEGPVQHRQTPPLTPRLPSQQCRSRRLSGGCHCKKSTCRTDQCVCHKSGRDCGPECTCLLCLNKRQGKSV